MRIVTVAALLVVLAIPAAASGQSPGTLAYSNFFGIATLPAAGGTPRQLTEGGEGEFSPAWAPDGTRVAFTSVSATTGVNSVEVIAITGGTREVVAQFASSPAWSPNGRKIVYSTSGGRRNGLAVAPASGGGGRQIVGGGARAGVSISPVWAPSGKLIYYLQGPAWPSGPIEPIDLLPNQLRKVEPNGTLGRRIPVSLPRGWRFSGQLDSLAVSPSGATLAIGVVKGWTRYHDGTSGVALVPSGGGAASAVFENYSVGSFAPDGSSLCLVTSRPPPINAPPGPLAIVSLDGWLLSNPGAISVTGCDWTARG